MIVDSITLKPNHSTLTVHGIPQEAGRMRMESIQYGVVFGGIDGGRRNSFVYTNERRLATGI